VIFSSIVLAAVPTPGSSFSGLLSFFRGIFTGTATMEDAYLISFILYFVLFLAIFMEGIKIIPFFGQRGETSKQGKVFAIAAAGLSTIALFIVEQGTQVSTADRVSHLVAPFGVWGGVIIATIMAYMTFRFIHDTELFKEHVLIAMAISAAVGVTLIGFILTMDNLVGWGFLALLVSFVVGAIVAILKHREETAPEREAQRKANVEKEVERFKEKDKAKKDKKELVEEAVKKKKGIERRGMAARPVRAHLVEAINACGKLYQAVAAGRLIGNRPAALAAANNELRTLRKKIKSSVKGLDDLQNKEKGDVQKVMIDLYHNSGVAFGKAKQLKLPKETITDWQAEEKRVHEEISVIGALCGQIISNLDVFIKHHENEELRTLAERRERL
ncbi:MAG: hypothetical protein KJ598_04160, partial [Nanoarchaeota archaeon]|nr:hypothetical protein [Nanoarchaeota archaeon]MBU1644324.1 hypothetical protein [Nanoarchaeota archaeon]